MEFEFYEKEMEIIKQAMKVNEDVIKTVIRKVADNIEDDKLIHTFGTGHSHMMGVELFSRAGGLGNVNAILDSVTLTAGGARRSGDLERVSGIADTIYDNYNIQKGDMIFITSNSGRNAMPIEMALRCKKEGVYVVAITNLKQSKNTTSRHSSGKKLYELADAVIDTCVPDGDCIMEAGKYKIGAGSSIVSLMILDTIITEAIKLVVSEGKNPYVYQSQNVDGANNEAVFRHFYGRVKHL